MMNSGMPPPRPPMPPPMPGQPMMGQTMPMQGQPMMGQPNFIRPPPVAFEDPAQQEARKAAAQAAAAAFASGASRIAETSRDAARDAATAKAAAPAMMTDPSMQGGYGGNMQGRGDSQPEMRAPTRLWLPEPTVQEPQMAQAAPPPPPPRRSSPSPRKKDRSRSNSRRARRNRRRGGGWDAADAPPAAPPPGADAVPSMAVMPSRPALPPGMMPSMPAMALGPGPSKGGGKASVNRFGIPEASPEALAAAVFRAQQVEAAGLEAMRSSGKIPRGPPDLPTGTEVIEQKCVAYLIGKGGQALAAINAAAGVSTQIDQSTKSFGWSMANIYGTEEGTAKAKLILRQKVSEYRPLRG